MSWWLTLITASPWLDFLPSRANPHHFCIASIFMAKPCVPEALAIYSWAFLVCRWLIPVSPLLFIHSGFFFSFFSEAVDDLGPGGCGGFNSCDCCCAPQDLRATSSNTHTHTHTCTHTRKHSESRFKSKETKKKKNAVSYHGLAEKWLWLGAL